ncbi:hypothetical protein Efla_004638 [Eimeria flavescens]
MTFHPTEPTGDLEIDDILCSGNVICTSSKLPTEVARLHITATGRGIPLPPDAVHVLTFATSVRTSTTKTFFIKNPKKVEWTTIPRLSLEVPQDVAYFSCSPSGPITIGPNEKAALQLTYRPLTMTIVSETQSANRTAEHLLPNHHSATVFCALPEGEACFIRLIGTSSEPSIEHVFEANATCKQQTSFAIKVGNWLDTHQTFNADYTILQPAGGHGIQVQAPTSLEIPGGQSRLFRFSALAFKPCIATIRFRFINPKTNDFTLEEAKIQFDEGDCMGLIHFDGVARQLQRHTLEIQNPLSKPASFQCTSSQPEIIFNPQPFSIPPQTTGVLDILMRPTLPGRGDAFVSLNSDELGIFKYVVKYNVRSPGVEKRITLAAALGKEAQQCVRFLHFGKKPTTFQLSLEPPHESQKVPNSADVFLFDCKAIQAPPDTDGQGVEVSIPIRFVPSRMQDFKAILCVRGGDGQEFKALLIGRATAPEAQGPMKVLKSKGLPVEFKNPLDLARDFTAQVDQAAFSLDKRAFRLEPRKSTILNVSLKNEQRVAAMVCDVALPALRPHLRYSGRLLISTDGLPPWIIYLKAE